MSVRGQMAQNESGQRLWKMLATNELSYEGIQEIVALIG